MKGFGVILAALGMICLWMCGIALGLTTLFTIFKGVYLLIKTDVTFGGLLSGMFFFWLKWAGSFIVGFIVSLITLAIGGALAKS